MHTVNFGVADYVPHFTRSHGNFLSMVIEAKVFLPRNVSVNSFLAGKCHYRFVIKRSFARFGT
jgi:hypothetical protein